MKNQLMKVTRGKCCIDTGTKLCTYIWNDRLQTVTQLSRIEVSRLDTIDLHVCRFTTNEYMIAEHSIQPWLKLQLIKSLVNGIDAPQMLVNDIPHKKHLVTIYATTSFIHVAILVDGHKAITAPTVNLNAHFAEKECLVCAVPVDFIGR